MRAAPGDRSGSISRLLFQAACLAIGLTVWGMALAAEAQTYTDRRYGYALPYPGGYVLEAPVTGGYITLFKEGRRVISAVVESLDETGKKELKQSADPWQAFILARAKISCDADGPDGSVYCDRIGPQRTWRNASGLRVIELYLRLVEERFGPPRTQRVYMAGPIYGVDLSRPGYVFGLLVGSGHEFPRTPEEKELVQKIVESVRLIPDAEFQPPQPLKVGPGRAFPGVPGKGMMPMPVR